MAASAARTNNRPQLSPGGSGGSNVASRRRWPGLGLLYRMAGGRHLLPTSMSSLSNKKDSCRKVRAAGHGSYCCYWWHPHPQPLVTTTMSATTITISTGGYFPPTRPWHCISMHGCTIRHCQQHALRRLGTQSPNQV